MKQVHAWKRCQVCAVKKLTAEEFAGAERETELENGLRLNLGEFDSSRGWRQLLAFAHRRGMLLLRGTRRWCPGPLRYATGQTGDPKWG